MKHNKTNAKLLGELSSTKRNEVELILEKEVPKNANKVVKQAVLNAKNKERAFKHQREEMSKGATDLSGLWTSPQPTVWPLLGLLVLLWGREGCGGGWGGRGTNPPFPFFSLEFPL
jgi:hypothetical protein